VLWCSVLAASHPVFYPGTFLGENSHQTRLTRSTQPCIPPGSLNRVPASAGVRAGMCVCVMCDPMWHVSSRSSVATLQTDIYTSYLLTYSPSYNNITCVHIIKRTQSSKTRQNNVTAGTRQPEQLCAVVHRYDHMRIVANAGWHSAAQHLRHGTLVDFFVPLL